MKYNMNNCSNKNKISYKNIESEEHITYITIIHIIFLF